MELKNILTIQSFSANENFQPIGEGINQLCKICTKEEALNEIKIIKNRYQQMGKTENLQFISFDQTVSEDFWQFDLKFKTFSTNKLLVLKIWKNIQD